MFKIYRDDKAMPGFSMTFENGWTVSVMFGRYNYCENLDRVVDFNVVCKPDCETAEIAAWDADGNWHDFGADTVKGWVHADEVADFIQMIKNK